MELELREIFSLGVKMYTYYQKKLEQSMDQIQRYLKGDSSGVRIEKVRSNKDLNDFIIIGDHILRKSIIYAISFEEIASEPGGSSQCYKVTIVVKLKEDHISYLSAIINRDYSLRIMRELVSD